MSYHPQSARITFFNSYALPLFDYGDIIWGNATLMAELQILHNKAARLILDLHPRASASDALAKLHWKPLQWRRAEHRAIFVYKSINDLFIHSFNFSFNSSFHNYNTRSKHNIRKSIAARRWGLDYTKLCSRYVECLEHYTQRNIHLSGI